MAVKLVQTARLALAGYASPLLQYLPFSLKSASVGFRLSASSGTYGADYHPKVAPSS
jgi:hypothetical protein